MTQQQAFANAAAGEAMKITRDAVMFEKSADIIPAVVEGMRNVIGWLERRRADELYINELTGDVEITAKKVDKILVGLKEWAGALEAAAAGGTEIAATLNKSRPKTTQEPIPLGNAGEKVF
jgi:hypothetical protein